MFRNSGTPSINAVGIQLSGLGGLAMNNSFQGWWGVHPYGWRRQCGDWQ
jgi:hypothetical protein